WPLFPDRLQLHRVADRFGAFLSDDKMIVVLAERFAGHLLRFRKLIGGEADLLRLEPVGLRHDSFDRLLFGGVDHGRPRRNRKEEGGQRERRERQKPSAADPIRAGKPLPAGGPRRVHGSVGLFAEEKSLHIGKVFEEPRPRLLAENERGGREGVRFHGAGSGDADRGGPFRRISRPGVDQMRKPPSPKKEKLLVIARGGKSPVEERDRSGLTL